MVTGDETAGRARRNITDTELAGRIAWAWMEADGYPSYGDLERDALDRRAQIAVSTVRQAIDAGELS